MSSAIMNQALIQPLSYTSEYNNLSSDQSCIEHIDPHAHHSPFTSGSEGRRDTLLGQSGLLPNGIRFLPRRSNGHDGRYTGTSGISDSGSTSISTSPGSNASGVLSPYTLSNVSSAYTPTALYSGSVGYQPSNVASRVSRIQSAPDSQPSALFAQSRSPTLLGDPSSPSAGATVRESYATATPHLNRHLLTSPRSQFDSRPTGVISASLPLSPTSCYPYNNTNMLGYQTGPSNSEVQTPPLESQVDLLNIVSNEDRSVRTQIEGKIEKGFFLTSDVWTCYRRNYFAVQCSFTVEPHISRGAYFVTGRRKHAERIQAFSMSISATVDSREGKSVELIQHTPKRDKGPLLPIEKQRIYPYPPGCHQSAHHSFALGLPHSLYSQPAPPHLPFQTPNDPSHAAASNPTPQSYSHTFERIQFKTATANNGKRRAAQQFYHLILELWADVRADDAKEPEWVKVAERPSVQLVVRGRSPSHYQNDGQNNNSSRGNGGGSGGGSGHSSLDSRGGGHRMHGTSFGGHLSVTGNSTFGAGSYRHGQYTLHQNPLGAPSVNTGLDSMSRDSCLVKDEDSKLHLNGHQEEYRYYPSPLYDAQLMSSTSRSAADESKRVKEELATSSSSFNGTWPSSCGRYQSTETSRGFYPDISAGY